MPVITHTAVSTDRYSLPPRHAPSASNHTYPPPPPSVNPVGHARYAYCCQGGSHSTEPPRKREALFYCRTNHSLDTNSPHSPTATTALTTTSSWGALPLSVVQQDFRLSPPPCLLAGEDCSYYYHNRFWGQTRQCQLTSLTDFEPAGLSEGDGERERERGGQAQSLYSFR